jgi:HD-GYP domain-containing protein (c-di-GMP phosphodiesterase class II)
MKMELNRDLLKSLLVFGAVIGARDAYTGGHVWRVARFAEILARREGLSDQDTFRASMGGFIHDIGKVGIPDSILNKPGQLTELEYKIMRTHPLVGQKIIAAHPLAPLVIDAINHHHERTDGNGYPEGVKRENISIYSKIVSIADGFDAMTSTRVYRPGMTKEMAILVLKENSGSQFDTVIVDHLIELCASGELDRVVGMSDEQRPLLTCPCCGPVIAVGREKSGGDSICCNSCKSEFVLHKKGGFFEIEATGKKQPAAQPEIDVIQIDEIARKAPKEIDL